MKLRKLLLGALLLVLALNSPITLAQSFCVYDPMGVQGDYFTLFKDYQLAAKRWSVDIDLKLYADDSKLNDAFRSGQCDMASMIGMRARSFNRFTGTIDAPSVIENYSEMRTVMNVMASPKLAKYMVSGPYEVVGMVPVGAAFPMVNDRHINSLEAGAGKKVSIMEWDKTQAMFAEDLHVVPVLIDLPSYGKAFNEGTVDIIVAPMVLYKPLELSKGIGSRGGIVRRPLYEFTMQVLTHADRFPSGFGQRSREFMNAQVDHALGIIRNTEADVDSRLWIYAVHSEVTEWNKAMRDVLAHLTKSGFFDQRMLTLLQRIRCQSAPDGFDCPAQDTAQTRETAQAPATGR